MSGPGETRSAPGTSVEVILLGTGTPNPDPGRSGSGVAVLSAGHWVLIDCGRGVTQRAIDAGLDLTALDAVMLTHHHSDHVSDLATLAIARWVAGVAAPLVVIAPDGPCGRYAAACLSAFADQAFYGQAGSKVPARPSITTIAFDPPLSVATIQRVGAWEVGAARVDHHPIEAAVGYGVSIASRRVVISGDTVVCAGIESLAAGADLLIHEAVLSAHASPSTLGWNASAGSVGEMAARLRLPRVVLTHLLPAPHTVADETAFVDEVREAGYHGDLTIATDLLRLEV